KPYPNTMVFFNSGVKLTVEGSEVLDDLKALEEAGVEIISCGTCLDYFNLKDKLSVGNISNMYTIYEKIRNSTNVVTIG
ncbi:sulfurtransferase-like selenium metabolism protein YedF, partial [Vibrio parahaemolyticus]|nr:sulfurtransferase-like selenium metabolism protein YedF [Vibrio parahaemolyticus]